jgi:hypothetical protein
MGLLSVAAVEWYDRANRLTKCTLRTLFVHIRTASHRSHSNVTQHGRTDFCKVAGRDPLVQSATVVRK